MSVTRYRQEATGLMAPDPSGNWCKYGDALLAAAADAFSAKDVLELTETERAGAEHDRDLAQRELAAYKQAVAERTEYAFKNEAGATPFRIDVFIQERVSELLAANA